MKTNVHVRSFLLVVSVAFAAALLAIPVHATTVLDQQYTAGSYASGFTYSGNDFRRAQTFTVGVAGTLSEVDIFYGDFYLGTPNSFGSFTGLNVFSTSSGIPTSTSLETGTLLSANSGVAKFSLSISVSVGDVLAIEPLTTYSSFYWLADSGANGYNGGGDYYIHPTYNVNNWTATGADNNFETFVTTGVSATPLPASLPLFASGLGAFGLLGWRRKRKKVAALKAA